MRDERKPKPSTGETCSVEKGVEQGKVQDTQMLELKEDREQDKERIV